MKSPPFLGDNGGFTLLKKINSYFTSVTSEIGLLWIFFQKFTRESFTNYIRSMLAKTCILLTVSSEQDAPTTIN